MKKGQYKIFWEDLHSYQPNAYSRTYYCTDMGVATFDTQQEVLEFADGLLEKGIVCYVLDYKAEPGIGALARHINKCFGQSFESYQRDRYLVAQMYAYIRAHNFPAVFPKMTKGE